MAGPEEIAGTLSHQVPIAVMGGGASAPAEGMVWSPPPRAGSQCFPRCSATGQVTRVMSIGSLPNTKGVRLKSCSLSSPSAVAAT